MADVISNLPTDTIPPTNEETELLKWLFPPSEEKSPTPKENETKVENNAPVISETPPKEKNRRMYFISFILIITVTFFILNLNVVNVPFRTIFPGNNQFVFALLKTFLFLMVFVFSIYVLKKV